ncbi:MAG: hypothetical protein ABI718_02800 [Acidobacteriota bacterium]
MSSSRYIVFALFLSLAVAVDARAQVNDTYVIPVSASLPGDFGTFWSTEFNIFNPQSHALKVRLIFLPTLTGQAIQVTVPVAANSNAWAQDVLDEVFDESGTGALLVATFPEDNPGVPDDVLSRSFLVNTKTFNNARTGTFGQFVPAVWNGLLDFDSDGITSIAHGIRNGGSSNFRTNVGAANLGRSTATLKVAVYDAAGRLIDTVPFIIPFMGHLQQRLPVSVDHGSVEFFLNDPSQEAVVFPYVSIIDNTSGDAVYMSPVLLASPSVLFQKAAAHQELGKKIGLETARAVAASARDLGLAGMVSTENGARIGRPSGI